MKAAEKKKRAEAAAKKRAHAKVVADIYAAADARFGPRGGAFHQGAFLHSAGMLDEDPAEPDWDLMLELPRTRPQKGKSGKKGWSTWDVDTPEFLEDLSNIKKEAGRKGIKMKYAVKNPTSYPTQALPLGYSIMTETSNIQARSGKVVAQTRYLLYRDGKDTGIYFLSPEKVLEKVAEVASLIQRLPPQLARLSLNQLPPGMELRATLTSGVYPARRGVSQGGYSQDKYRLYIDGQATQYTYATQEGGSIGARKVWLWQQRGERRSVMPQDRSQTATPEHYMTQTAAGGSPVDRMQAWYRSATRR